MGENFFILLIILIMLALIGVTVYMCAIDYQYEETIEIIIKDKYVKRAGKNTDQYMVAGDNGETYKITDLFFKGKFDSTDLYNQLEIGNKYKITVTGVRIHFLSMYRNINQIEKIN